MAEIEDPTSDTGREWDTRTRISEALVGLLRFRDRLRDEPALAAEYADLKRELAERHQDDREAYSAAKGAFVRRVESSGGRPFSGARAVAP